MSPGPSGPYPWSPGSSGPLSLVPGLPGSLSPVRISWTLLLIAHIPGAPGTCPRALDPCPISPGPQAPLVLVIGLPRSLSLIPGLLGSLDSCPRTPRVSDPWAPVPYPQAPWVLGSERNYASRFHEPQRCFIRFLSFLFTLLTFSRVLQPRFALDSVFISTLVLKLTKRIRPVSGCVTYAPHPVWANTHLK